MDKRISLCYGCQHEDGELGEDCEGCRIGLYTRAMTGFHPKAKFCIDCESHRKTPECSRCTHFNRFKPKPETP